MTWLWILLWIAIAVIILGSFFWSTIILQRQKKAWSDFAKKYDLDYQGGKYLESPAVVGPLKGYGVSLFTAVRDPDDVKEKRYVSVIEIKSPRGFSAEGAAGTQEMHNFMQSLGALSPYEVPFEKWNKTWRVYAKNLDEMSRFFSRENAVHIGKILNMKNADTLLIFNKDEGAVRLETSDPVNNTESIERVILNIIKHLDALMSPQQKLEAPPEQIKGPERT